MIYAPADESGNKPFLVTISDWGRVRTELVYAIDSTTAKYAATGPKMTGIYVTNVRRATPEDVTERGNAGAGDE